MNREQKCDRCSKSYLFMKLYPSENYSEFMICEKCKSYDTGRGKKEVK